MTALDLNYNTPEETKKEIERYLQHKDTKLNESFSVKFYPSIVTRICEEFAAHISFKLVNESLESDINLPDIELFLDVNQIIPDWRTYYMRDYHEILEIVKEESEFIQILNK